MRDFSGCKTFEADWKEKNIVNITSFTVPIPYGAIIPIQCSDGYKKISGSDNITCLEDNTFSGLSDIQCFCKYKKEDFKKGIDDREQDF